MLRPPSDPSPRILTGYIIIVILLAIVIMAYGVRLDYLP